MCGAHGVTTRFEGNYKTINSAPERLLFGKNLGDDFERVNIEVKPVGQNLHIRFLVQRTRTNRYT